MSNKVLFITHRGERHQQVALASAPKNFEVTMLRDPSKEEIIQNLAGKQFLITERSEVLDAGIIAAGKDLRLIQRLGSQVYDIDLAAAQKANIAVCYAPIEMTVSVAEHLMTQLLALARNLRESMYVIGLNKDWGLPPKKCDEDQFVVNFTGRKQLRMLYHSTVGIVGLGEIGIELSRRLRGFDCTVLYNKRTRLTGFAEKDLNIHYEDLDSLLAKSDFVCMLLPFSADTEGCVNLGFIRKMKKGAFLVSSGASGILNEADVREALKAGELAGVATDTYAWEPVRLDNPLLVEAAQDPEANIVLTPHTASGAVDPKVDPDRSGDYANLVRLLQNEPLLNRVV